jgi:hypothetical protein
MPFSYSDAQQYRRCPKAYYYRKVRNLQTVQRAWRADLGTWLHELQAASNRGKPWLDRHAELYEEFAAEVIPYANPDDDILEIPELARAIKERYDTKYVDDGELFRVLNVEESFTVAGIGFTPDLVIELVSTGDIWVWDYKSSVAIPEEWDLYDDTQGVLYTAGVGELYGHDRVKGVVFDYMRTKVPTVPRLNKTIKRDLGHPDIHDVARIDTTYDILMDFAARNGVPPYPALVDKLAELEHNDRFFRRIWLPIPEAARQQAVVEAVMTETMAKESTENDMFPRTILPPSAGTRACKGCGFQPLCQAELFGLDTSGILDLYEERQPLNRNYQEIPND